MFALTMLSFKLFVISSYPYRCKGYFSDTFRLSNNNNEKKNKKNKNNNLTCVQYSKGETLWCTPFKVYRFLFSRGICFRGIRSIRGIRVIRGIKGIRGTRDVQGISKV